MKNLLIIYNVIFLLAGNVLFSNIHHNHNHNHNHNHGHDYKNHECEDCINIENAKNYISDFKEAKFSNNNTNLFINQYFSVIKIKVLDIFLSRSPPIS